MTPAAGRAVPLPRTAIAAVLVCLAGTAAAVKIRSYDVWWHLETGRRILETFSIPRADDYSFTSAGTAWIDHEWLFQILAWLLHAAAGPAGLTLLKAACALGVAGIGYAALRRTGTAQGTALGVTALAVLGLRFRLAERPETITLMLAAAFSWIVLSLLERPAPAGRRLAAAALLSALWSNFHAGALLAPALACALGCGGLLDAALAPREARPQLRAGAFSALAAAVVSGAGLLLNPYGWRIYAVPLGISRALAPANLVNPEWAPPSWSGFRFFFFAVAAAGSAAAVSLARRRGLAGARGGLLLLVALLACASVRHVGVFFALAPLCVDTGGPTPWPVLNRGARATGVALALFAATWMALVPPAGAQAGLGVAEDRFPVKAADFIDANLPDARLYNDVAFGGYLIWRGYPVRRVFIDGRNEVHAALLAELSESLDDGLKWRALLERYGVEGAVTGYRDVMVRARDAVTGATTFSTFSELHFPKKEWSLVYWDDVAMIFLRRDGRYRGLAAALEYRASRPEAWRQGTDERSIVGMEPGLAEEIRRKLAQDATCRLANRAAKVYGVDSGAPSR